MKRFINQSFDMKAYQAPPLMNREDKQKDKHNQSFSNHNMDTFNSFADEKVY